MPGSAMLAWGVLLSLDLGCAHLSPTSFDRVCRFLTRLSSLDLGHASIVTSTTGYTIGRLAGLALAVWVSQVMGFKSNTASTAQVNHKVLTSQLGCRSDLHLLSGIIGKTRKMLGAGHAQEG